jgi:hypothetical protein
MKKSGSVFPDRIDSFSQLPLLKDNNYSSIAINCIRSSVLKIEESIGEKILDSRFFNKFKSLKDRIDFIEENILSTQQLFNIDKKYSNLTVLRLTPYGWITKEKLDDCIKIGVVLNNKIITNGILTISVDPYLNVGMAVHIDNGVICESHDKYFIGYIIEKNESNIAKILLRNTW